MSRILSMMTNPNRFQRIGIDILGYLLIIAAAATGWLPGPGGIPLLILGLSLLATNHEWAERWLAAVRRHGIKLSAGLFKDNPRTHLLIDIASILFIAGAVLLLSYFTGVVRTAGVSLILVSLLLFFGNRQRGTRLKQKFFKHK